MTVNPITAACDDLYTVIDKLTAARKAVDDLTDARADHVRVLRQVVFAALLDPKTGEIGPFVFEVDHDPDTFDVILKRMWETVGKATISYDRSGNVTLHLDIDEMPGVTRISMSQQATIDGTFPTVKAVLESLS